MAWRAFKLWMEETANKGWSCTLVLGKGLETPRGQNWTCYEIHYMSSNLERSFSRVETESDGTRRNMGGEVKGKEANGVGSQHSCTVSEHGLSSVTTADPHTSAASSRLN